jgi:hypothetical protein
VVAPSPTLRLAFLAFGRYHLPCKVNQNMVIFNTEIGTSLSGALTLFEKALGCVLAPIGDWLVCQRGATLVHESRAYSVGKE